MDAYRWEYRDLVIPLNLSAKMWTTWEAAAQKVSYRANAVILGALQRKGAEGWQADEPTDFMSLLSRDRILYEWGLVRGSQLHRRDYQDEAVSQVAGLARRTRRNERQNMQQSYWHYEVTAIGTQGDMTYQMLKEEGNQGWELVSFTPLRTRVNQDGTTETEYFCAVFKKPASTPR